MVTYEQNQTSLQQLMESSWKHGMIDMDDDFVEEREEDTKTEQDISDHEMDRVIANETSGERQGKKWMTHVPCQNVSEKSR